jgi:hypothetical protein
MRDSIDPIFSLFIIHKCEYTTKITNDEEKKIEKEKQKAEKFFLKQQRVS